MSYRAFFALFLWGAFTGISLPSQAGSLSVSVEIPQLRVAEYHRPYIALWIAQENFQAVQDLAVWYDLELKDNEGEKWLKDMRQWWRRSGRTKTMPLDGVTGATRAPGKHFVLFQSGTVPLGDLAPGKYLLMVEAVREVGGRELLEIPFSWPVEEEETFEARGEEELGDIVLTVSP